MSKLQIIYEIFDFIKSRRKWFLVPVVFFLILLSFILVLGEGSVMAPFIYAIF